MSTEQRNTALLVHIATLQKGAKSGLVVGNVINPRMIKRSCIVLYDTPIDSS